MKPVLPRLFSLMLGLACATGAAEAQATARATHWTRLNSTSASTLYIDTSSIQDAKDGNASLAAHDRQGSRVAWTLRSFRKAQTTPDGKAYRSLRAQHEYACRDHTATLLAQAYYPEVLGKGEAVGNFKYEQYDAEKITPGSPLDSAYKRACRKRRR